MSFVATSSFQACRKFLSIYDALDAPYPTFVSLPPIMNSAGNKKLSKRDGAKDLFVYKEEGYLPETMVNFLALIGWNPGTKQEIFSQSELLEAFDINKIQKSGGAFNEEKLLWMNREHLQKLPDAAFVEYVTKALPAAITSLPHFSTDTLERLLPNIRERVHLAREITNAAAAGEYTWAFAAPDVATDIIAWKNDESATDAVPRLQKAHTLLAEADFSSPDTIKDALWDYAEEVGRGELLWPLRVSLTGLERSPDPFMCAYVLQKEETLSRIQSACDKIEGNEST